jgi:8-amino-7-oxononanoate synthase
MQRPTSVNTNQTQTVPPSVTKRLQDRLANGNFRTLNPEKKLVDFVSNDYLGFSSSGLLKNRLSEYHQTNQTSDLFYGSTGSRLLSGDSEFTHSLEQKIAKYHNAQDALLFNCGYSANFGLISSVATRHDTIIYDELSHASIIDGATSARAKNCFSFKHNDIHDLEQKISKASGDTYVITESVFSMDGDFAPLTEIASVCQKTGAYLIVDEAHSFGIFGPNGSGTVCELSLENQVFARIVTYGKALGAHGAAVLGNSELKKFLINFCRPFIYSTALDRYSIDAVNIGYDLLKETSANNAPLFFLIHEFRNTAKKECKETNFLDSLSPIQGIIIPDNLNCKKASLCLADANIDARAILSPTVPAGKERIRIILHTYNSTSEVQLLFHTLKINGFI